MTNSLQNEIKEAIIAHWRNQLNAHDCTSKLENISNYHIDALNHVNTFFNSSDSSDSDSNCHTKNEDNTKDNNRLDKLTDDQIYVFHRQLTGGTGINEDRHEIYVPEGIVRKLDIEHGDKLHINEDVFGYGRHYYEKLNHLPKDETIEPNKIIDYDFAIVEGVEDIDDKFIVRHHYGSEGLTSMPNRIIYQPDIDKFDLKEGDLVHVSFYDDNNARVRWKYSHNEPIPTPKPQKSSVYKDSSSSHDDVEQTLKNIIIGVIGYGNLDTSYEEEITKRGGEMISTSAVDSDTIENKIRQSDIVVMPTHHMGHKQMDITKKLCKYYDKPLVIVNKGGRSHFVQQIHEKLEEMKNIK